MAPTRTSRSSAHKGLRPFSSSVLKGHANYIILPQLGESRLAGTQGVFGADDPAPGERAAQVRQIFAWAERTTTPDVAASRPNRTRSCGPR